MKQKHQMNNAEPSTEQDEELDVVEAFKTCHTSSKHGLSEPARDAVVSPDICFGVPFCLLVG
jgi:GH24 family phage-related lysozyme (muramidase)